MSKKLILRNVEAKRRRAESNALLSSSMFRDFDASDGMAAEFVRRTDLLPSATLPPSGRNGFAREAGK